MQVQEEIDQPIKLEYLSGQCESVGSMFEQNHNVSSIPRAASSLPMKPFDDQSMTSSMEITHAAKLLQASQQHIVTPILTTSPASNIASAVKLASMGVQFGPGINPNISNPANGCGTNGTNSIQNNPPIVNTGNNGPMCVQPGDWVCSKCGFVNWRRRRVCMRCFPLADQNNEMSRSLVTGAALAAQIAAGMEPSADLVASLTTTTTNRRMTNGNQTTLFSSSTSNPTTPKTTLLPSRNNTLNSLIPFKPSQSTSNYVDNTLSFNFQNATISEPQQWNYTQPLPFSAGGHQYNNNHPTFYSVQPSPIHSPIIPKMYDQQISKPELTRHAHSSSVLSSLSRYSAENGGGGFTHQDKQSAKSGGATPMEEDQMDLYDLWFGSSTNKQRLDKQTRSNSPQLSKNVFTLSSQHFSPLQNKKLKMDEGETNDGESTNNVITVSAANETDEIVVPCASEKRYSYTNGGGKMFKTSTFQQIEKGVNGNNNNNRLLPIEPPSSITNANALANSSIVITTATTQKDCSPKQQNCSTTPTRK